MSELEAFFSDTERDLRDLLEPFVAKALFDAGVWASARESDGIMAYRIIERTAMHVRLCGQLWTIDQTTHYFWLDVIHVGEESASRCDWALYFDIDVTAGDARLRHGIDSIQHRDDVTWTVQVKGLAM